MVSATQRLNILLNLKKFAQIWAKRVVVPGWTKEKLIALAMQRKLYKTKTAASKVSNVTLAEQLGIDIKTGGEKQASKPKPDPTPKPETTPVKKEEKPDIAQLDLDKELSRKGGFRKMQALFKAAGLKPGTSKQTLINAYEKWKEKNGVKKEEKEKEKTTQSKPKVGNLKDPDQFGINPTKDEEEFYSELTKGTFGGIFSKAIDEVMQIIKAPPPSKTEVASLRQYTGMYYSTMNKALRGQAKNASKEAIELANNLTIYATNGLKTAPEKMRHKGEVYRVAVLKQEDIDKYELNEIIEEKAFASTSKSPAMAEGISAVAAKNKGSVTYTERSVIFTINSKAGVDISEIAKYPDEQEVLFPPKTKFKVLKKEVDKDGVTRIYLDEQ